MTGSGTTKSSKSPSSPHRSRSTPVFKTSPLRSKSSLSPSKSGYSQVILSPAGRPCLVCFDHEKDGVQCTENHFVCRGCLQGLVRSLEPAQIRRSEGKVSCPWVGVDGSCEADPWDYDELANLLDPLTQRVYVQRLQGLLATVLHGEAERRESGRRSRTTSSTAKGTSGGTGAAAPSTDEEKLRLYRQHVAEEVLTLKCPREGCRRAFLDFDGCFALTCPSCGGGFCAACILDCGDDAHDHCRKVHEGYFGTIERFNEVQHTKRIIGVASYLTSLQETPEVLDALLSGYLVNDLQEVGIKIEDIKYVMKGGKLVIKEKQEAERIRLHYPNDAAMGRTPRYFRLFLDGPGYVEQDPLSHVLGALITVSTMGGAVWWLTSNPPPAEKTIFLDKEGVDFRHVIFGLISGSALILLLTGRSPQLVQALYVTTLTAVLCIPLYLIGPIFSWTMYVILRLLSTILDLIGLLLDLVVKVVQPMTVLANDASIELLEISRAVRRVVPLADWLVLRTMDLLDAFFHRGKCMVGEAGALAGLLPADSLRKEWC